ncbi:subtype B tannase [Glacieibacterium sp.]|uniref:subtype B tannase n=1 Tax=Glacieibacterium sp. TaxID=2860237 RepID=UPI003B00E650
MARTGLLFLACLAGAVPAVAQAPTSDRLAFNPDAFTTVRITIDGQPVAVRRYRVVYVAKPVAIDTAATPRFGPPGGGPGGVDGGGIGPGAPTSNATAPANGIGPMGAASDPYAYQTMYIYVPAATFRDGRAAIILQVNNGGWMASPARDIVQEGGTFSSTSDTDNTGAALKAGYVVVSAGTRGRGIRAIGGDWAGKSPAAIVDAKAAVRYLRYNDKAMPGSAQRIVITGTSGGGGLSAAVSASGNSPDYLPYLAAIGAAGVDANGRSSVRDDVFATIAYCPINDLGNADAAYEWQFGPVRTAANSSNGGYTPAAQAASAALAASYPSVLAGLRLRREDGSAVTTDTLQQAVLGYVKASVEAAIARGERVPALGEDFMVARRGRPGAPPATPARIRNQWLTVEGGQVRSIDYAKYLSFVAEVQPLKGVPAFDATANTGATGVVGENTLFGSAKNPYANFTAYGWNNNEVRGDGSGRDDTGLDWAAYIAGPGAGLGRQLRLASPIPYLNSGTSVAPYWYVRHGLVDRDIAFASQATLVQAVRNAPKVKDVNFKLAWMQGHAGNYDVREAYGWLADTLRKAGRPTPSGR